jgi:hypothetical protein
MSAELVAAVKKHARQNYEKQGWDIVVECFEDADILKLIDGATSERDAIERVLEDVRPHHEYRRDIQAENGDVPCGVCGHHYVFHEPEETTCETCGELPEEHLGDEKLCGLPHNGTAFKPHEYRERIL